MVFAAAALLLQLYPLPTVTPTKTEASVTTAPSVAAVPATPAPGVSTGETAGTTKSDAGAANTQTHLNLEGVKLFAINSGESTTPPSGDASGDSLQNSQSLSTVHIPEPKPVKPIPSQPSERMPSRRTWLALSFVQHSAATFDAYATRQAVENGAVERNPLMRPFVHSPAAYGAIQVCPVLLDYISRRMQRSDRGLFRHTWWIPQSLSAGVYVFAGVHNLNVTNRQQAINGRP